MSEHRYEIVEDGQIEMTEAEMEAASRVPLPSNSMSFTTVSDIRTRLIDALDEHMGTDAQCSCGWKKSPIPQEHGEKGWPAGTHRNRDHLADVLLDALNPAAQEER